VLELAVFVAAAVVVDVAVVVVIATVVESYMKSVKVFGLVVAKGILASDVTIVAFVTFSYKSD